MDEKKPGGTVDTSLLERVFVRRMKECVDQERRAVTAARANWESRWQKRNEDREAFWERNGDIIHEAAFHAAASIPETPEFDITEPGISREEWVRRCDARVRFVTAVQSALDEHVREELPEFNMCKRR